MIDSYQTVDKNCWYICDALLKTELEDQWFDNRYWLNQGRLLGANSGRGSTWTIKSEHGKWVLRHYYRGGMYALLNRDKYFWTGKNNSRAFREFNILTLLQKLKLPAPQPVAARIQKKLFYYRTDLIMHYIPHQFTFAKFISESGNSVDKIKVYTQVGHTIAKFHQHNIFHSDLNAHNILLKDEETYLIDFDKGKQMTKSGSWKMANINRLKRSIEKISGLSCENELSEHWSALIQGYKSL